MNKFCFNELTYGFSLVYLLALAACVPGPQTRLIEAQQMAHAHQWRQQTLETGPFRIAAFMPQSPSPTDTLTLYIEGDGMAWRDRGTPSSDPTPRDPMALRLALRHGSGAAYIARPCQFTPGDPACADRRWWTSHRFAPEMVQATHRAVDAVKQRFGARHVVLVGYSGGGAVAALVAAGRSDVTGLITLAGNLDTEAWTTLHGIRPLSGSLNPADHWAALRHLPQHHYSGAADTVVPPAIARAFAGRFPAGERPAVTVLEGFDHACCWAERGPDLTTTPPAQ